MPSCRLTTRAGATSPAACGSLSTVVGDVECCVPERHVSFILSVVVDHPDAEPERTVARDRLHQRLPEHEHGRIASVHQLPGGGRWLLSRRGPVVADESHQSLP